MNSMNLKFLLSRPDLARGTHSRDYKMTSRLVSRRYRKVKNTGLVHPVGVAASKHELLIRIGHSRVIAMLLSDMEGSRKPCSHGSRATGESRVPQSIRNT